jgi:hypothetical protein
MQCDRSCQPSSCVIRRPVNVFRNRHTASLLVSRFNHTRTARLSGSEGRTPAHRPPLFACIDGHALARQKHIYSSDRKHNCRIAHTQRNLDRCGLSCSSFKVGTQFPPRFWPLSRGSALQRSGYFGLHTYAVYSRIQTSEP